MYYNVLYKGKNFFDPPNQFFLSCGTDWLDWKSMLRPCKMGPKKHEKWEESVSPTRTPICPCLHPHSLALNDSGYP